MFVSLNEYIQIFACIIFLIPIYLDIRSYRFFIKIYSNIRLYQKFISVTPWSRNRRNDKIPWSVIFSCHRDTWGLNRTGNRFFGWFTNFLFSSGINLCIQFNWSLLCRSLTRKENPFISFKTQEFVQPRSTTAIYVIIIILMVIAHWFCNCRWLSPEKNQIETLRQKAADPTRHSTQLRDEEVKASSFFEFKKRFR